MHLRVKGIQVCSKKCPALFQEEIIMKKRKYIKNIKNLLPQNHWANINKTWQEASLGEGDSILLKKNNLILIIFFSSLYQRYDIHVIICVYWFELFSQVSDLAPGPLFSSRRSLNIQYLSHFCMDFAQIFRAFVTFQTPFKKYKKFWY